MSPCATLLWFAVTLLRPKPPDQAIFAEPRLTAYLACGRLVGISCGGGAGWLLSQTQRIGPRAARWSEAVVQARGVEGVRVLQGLLALAGKHRGDCLEKACEIALSYGSYRLKTVRTLLDRDAPGQESFAFIDEHP